MVGPNVYGVDHQKVIDEYQNDIVTLKEDIKNILTEIRYETKKGRTQELELELENTKVVATVRHILCLGNQRYLFLLKIHNRPFYRCHST